MTDYGSAIRSISDRTFCQSQKYRDQQLRADRSGAHPDILEFERRLITKARKQDIPLYCHCCNRGQHEQTNLFVRGVTKARAGQSAHNYGLAIDVIHSVKAWDIDRKAWAFLGHMGKEISVQSGIEVTWGGDWKFWDPSHWELRDWKTLSKTRSLLK